MIFVTICLVGLVFVALTLPSALRKRPVQDTDDAPPFIVDLKPNRSCREKDPDFSPLARDRQEVLEIWEKCSNDPSCPPPIPPVKPTVYFGNETIAGGFGPESD